MPTEASFRGHIAGFGTAAGPRIVIGLWLESPFGRLLDVMIETPEGHRTLVAPDEASADYIAGLYTFDERVVAPTSGHRLPDALSVAAGPLQVDLALGGPAPLDRALRLVPRRLSRSPRWSRALDPVAARLVPGARTVGRAGGRTETYGVLRSREITDIVGTLDGQDLGGLRPLDPPVRFGFATAPKRPQVLSVVTTVSAD